MKYHENRGTSGKAPSSAQTGAVLITVVAIIVAALLLLSVHHLTPVDVYVQADVSISNSKDQRESEFQAFNAAIDSVFPISSNLSIWSFDFNAEKRYDGNPSTSQDLTKAERELIDYKSITENTRPTEALKEIIAAMRRPDHKDRDSVVVLIWDGGLELGPTELKKQVQQLAAMPHLKALWIIGAKPDEGLRSTVDDIFAPLAGRVIVSGTNDCEAGINKLRSILNKTREEARHD